MSEGVLIAIIGAIQAVSVALLVPLLSRMKRVEADTKAARVQTENSHGTNLRDDLDKVRDLAEHAVRAARKASTDTIQLREDVQALRTDHTGTASDIRGIRKDIGRLADIITQKGIS